MEFLVFEEDPMWVSPLIMDDEDEFSPHGVPAEELVCLEAVPNQVAVRVPRRAFVTGTPFAFRQLTGFSAPQRAHIHYVRDIRGILKQTLFAQSLTDEDFEDALYSLLQLNNLLSVPSNEIVDCQNLQVPFVGGFCCLCDRYHYNIRLSSVQIFSFNISFMVSKAQLRERQTHFRGSGSIPSVSGRLSIVAVFDYQLGKIQVIESNSKRVFEMDIPDEISLFLKNEKKKK